MSDCKIAVQELYNCRLQNYYMFTYSNNMDIFYIYFEVLIIKNMRESGPE